MSIRGSIIATNNLRSLLVAAGIGLLGACSHAPERPASSILTIGAAFTPEFTIRDMAGAGRVVPLRISFPTRNHARTLPIVIFSHGAYSSKDDYTPITDYWAAAGFLVIAATHIDSTTRGQVRGMPTPPNAYTERLADVQLIIARLDEIEARVPALRGRLAKDRIAVTGHSFGGLIAENFCGLLGTNPATHASLDMRDARVRAVIAFSGVGELPPLVTRAHFATLSKPMLVTVGTQDLGMGPSRSGYELRREPYDIAPPGDKYLLVLDGADHYLGGMVCRDDIPRSPRGAEYVQTFNDASTLFLRAYLQDDATALSTLSTKLPHR